MGGSSPIAAIPVSGSARDSRVASSRPDLVRSVAAAAGVLLCLLWSGQELPLPALGWAAGFLFLAVQQDVIRMRIPNWLTFPALLVGFAWSTWTGGGPGALVALAGAGTAFGVLFVPWLLGWLGAGDVKAMMALGTLWGAYLLLGVLWWAVVAGGVFAIGAVALHGQLGALLRRWRDTIVLTVATKRWTYLPAPAGSVTAIPFAVAIGLGMTAYQLWGVPWAA